MENTNSYLAIDCNIYSKKEKKKSLRSVAKVTDLRVKITDINQNEE